MDVSVVVVTFNSEACIDACLDSVKRHLPEAEIVVVDNASTDATREVVHARPGARLVENVQNDGFGRACNTGARASHGTHLLFLNPDVLVTRYVSNEFRLGLTSDPFGLVGPESKEANGLIGAQCEPGLLHDWFEQTLGTLRPREWPRRSGLVKRRSGDAWLSGSMLLVERGEFLRLGGFDPRFFLYYEDRDLAARYRQAGLPIRVTGALSGVHAAGNSSSSDDLRVVPAGWAFLGWIEYVFLHRGERTARVMARTGIATLETLRLAVVGAAQIMRKQRLERKRRQLEELLAFIEEKTVGRTGNDKSFCPEARRLLGTVR